MKWITYSSLLIDSIDFYQWKIPVVVKFTQLCLRGVLLKSKDQIIMINEI